MMSKNWIRVLFLGLCFAFTSISASAYNHLDDLMTDEELDQIIEELIQSEIDAEFWRNNIHLIDKNEDTGFALYRTSRPSQSDMKMFCELGIQEMLVLSGTADNREWRFQSACPELEVVANIPQTTSTPVDVSFLEFFDQWVQEAQAEGKIIAFRCECGCHRTGRLAAYYQMKYQGKSLAEARKIMTQQGKFMWLFPNIYQQVNAIHDHLNGQPCSTRERFCVGL